MANVICHFVRDAYMTAVRGPLAAFLLLGALFAAGSASATLWHLVSPRPAWAQLYSISASSGRVHVGGVDGQMARSEDGGATWTQTGVVRENQFITAMATDGNRTIAIGPTGYYLYSDAASAWIARTLPPGVTSFNAVVHGARWVALANEGSTWISNDGLTWSPGGGGLGAGSTGKMSFGSGRYLFIGIGGIYSSNDGVGWSLALNSTDFRDAEFDGTKWVAVGFRKSATSPDGDVWTLHDLSSTSVGTMVDVAYGNGKFVAVGSGLTTGSFALYYSSDGVVWTSATPPAGELATSTFAVAWTGSRFIATHAYGSIIQSTDGSAWTSASKGYNEGLLAVAKEGSRYVAVGESQNYSMILTSADGSNWVDHSPAAFAAPETFGAIVGHQGRFVALRRFSDQVGTSSDGISWSLATIDATLSPGWVQLGAIGSSGTTVVAAGTKDQVFSSNDGISWTRTRTGPDASSKIHSVTWTGAQWVLSGDFSSVLTSVDGNTWTDSPIAGPAWPSTGTPWFNGLAFGNGTYIGVVRLGREAILRSTDLLNWTEVTPSNMTLAHACTDHVIWTGSTFVASGFYGTCTSSDGIVWTAQGIGRSTAFKDIIVGGEGLLAVGNAILTRSAIPNRTPIAIDMAYNGTAGQSFNGQLVANDADGDELWFSITTQPSSGTARIVDPVAGTFAFTPNSATAGSVTFTFSVDDGSGTIDSGTATISLGAAGGSTGGGGGCGDLLFISIALFAGLRRRARLRGV